MAAVLQHETGLLFIEWYILLTGIANAVLMIAEPFDYLAVHYGLFHYLFAVLKLYLGVKVAIGFYAHEGTHLAEAVAAALLKAHGLRIAAIAAVMTVTVMLMIEFDLTVQSLFVYKLLEPGVNIQ